MILRRGSPLQRNLCRSSDFAAKSVACCSVWRLSRDSDIHSRMIVRRALCSGFTALLLCGCRLRYRRQPAPACRQCATVRAERRCLDRQGTALKQAEKLLVVGRLLRVDPDYENARRVEKLEQPIERRLERTQRALPPIHQSDVVVSGRRPTVCRRHRPAITAPVQLEGNLYAPRACDDDRLLFRAAGKRKHRLDDLFGVETGTGHDCHRAGERAAGPAPATGFRRRHSPALSRIGIREGLQHARIGAI